LAVYKIVQIGNEVLREPAKKVPKITDSIIKLLDNMAETLEYAKGIGLAAPQIGVSKQVVLIDFGDERLELINPTILDHAGEEADTEGCLSMPGKLGEILRAAKVTVRYLDRHGQEHVLEAEGLLSRALQHEIDHLNGVLIIDHTNEFWDAEK
jgi:peptide deformylase